MAHALTLLIEAIETNTFVYNDLLEALPDDRVVWDKFEDAYDGDLNAANYLHDAMLAGWNLNLVLHWWGDCSAFLVRKDLSVEVKSEGQTKPARAWLLAILKAKLAQV